MLSLSLLELSREVPGPLRVLGPSISELVEEAEKIEGSIQEIDCKKGIDNTALAIGMYIQDLCSPAAN